MSELTIEIADGLIGKFHADFTKLERAVAKAANGPSDGDEDVDVGKGGGYGGSGEALQNDPTASVLFMPSFIAAVTQTLLVVGDLRDFMQNVLREGTGTSRERLKEIFGGDCHRIAHVHALVESLQGLLEGTEYEKDERIPQCMAACRSIECVLKDQGYGITLGAAQNEERMRLMCAVADTVEPRDRAAQEGDVGITAGAPVDKLIEQHPEATFAQLIELAPDLVPVGDVGITAGAPVDKLIEQHPEATFAQLIQFSPDLLSVGDTAGGVELCVRVLSACELGPVQYRPGDVTTGIAHALGVGFVRKMIDHSNVYAELKLIGEMGSETRITEEVRSEPNARRVQWGDDEEHFFHFTGAGKSELHVILRDRKGARKLFLGDPQIGKGAYLLEQKIRDGEPHVIDLIIYATYTSDSRPAGIVTLELCAQPKSSPHGCSGLYGVMQHKDWGMINGWLFRTAKEAKAKYKSLSSTLSCMIVGPTGDTLNYWGYDEDMLTGRSRKRDMMEWYRNPSRQGIMDASWSEEQQIRLCTEGEESRFEGTITLLDKFRFTSVPQAVAALSTNEGLDLAPAGSCVVYDNRNACYIFLYRKDHQHSAMQLLKPLRCKKGCGRSARPGVAKNGRPYDTCCRGCALGEDHAFDCEEELTTTG